MTFPLSELPDELAFIIFQKMDNTTLRKLKKINQLSYYFNEIDTLLFKDNQDQISYHIFNTNYFIFNCLNEQALDEKKVIDERRYYLSPIPQIETSLHLNKLLINYMISSDVEPYPEKIIITYKCMAKSIENKYTSVFRKVILNEDIKQEINEYINDEMSDTTE